MSEFYAKWAFIKQLRVSWTEGLGCIIDSRSSSKNKKPMNRWMWTETSLWGFESATKTGCKRRRGSRWWGRSSIINLRNTGQTKIQASRISVQIILFSLGQTFCVTVWIWEQRRRHWWGVWVMTMSWGWRLSIPSLPEGV